ncbi:head GIN domain-containing protein [Flavivirga amylovorans]|uniref:Head GIN domain-containing protein n=1 Tax=Flavivirga amylovorans TaxID=870486 RepID=A0ABT8X481_9FLAO|nr:head GIN domain-containing protein [Flavivirga amylovorans]MDO5988781.1 head GIN domain-containing protein [Flavivirga amylovorans]
MKTRIKKQTVLIIATLLLASTSYAQWKSIRGNGNMKTITRTTSEYDGIKCAGNMDFIIVNGSEGNIKIEGEENLLEYIITEVKNNNLVIKTKKGINLKSGLNKTIKITIPVKDINEVALAGSGDLWSKDIITTTNLDVSLAGSGDVSLNIKTTSVKASIAGSGDLKLEGNTNNLEAKIAGSGDFHGFNLQTNNTDVSIAGSGDAKVISNKALKARVSGSGDISYKGDPIVDSKVVGSGNISNN